MSQIVCRFRPACTTLALIASVIVGVVTAFLQITGVILATPVFLWVALGVAVGYLAIQTLAAALASRRETAGCCRQLGTVLVGILGTILLSVVLLAVGIVATSILSAILVGLLLFFLALTVTGTACYIRCLTVCGD